MGGEKEQDKKRHQYIEKINKIQLVSEAGQKVLAGAKSLTCFGQGDIVLLWLYQL